MEKRECIHRWSIADIADAVAESLRELSQADRKAQAVRGLDSLDEVELQTLIGQALSSAGFGVWPEERYPRFRTRALRSQGDRCDFVLTPDGTLLRDQRAAHTLFAHEDAVEPEDAFWLEMKVVAQFKEEGPNARYATEIQEPVRRDIRKLAGDNRIAHAAVLLVLFTQDDAVAMHDVITWQKLCHAKGLPVAPAYVRRVDIVDRLGNAMCFLAFFGIER